VPDIVALQAGVGSPEAPAANVIVIVNDVPLIVPLMLPLLLR